MMKTYCPLLAALLAAVLLPANQAAVAAGSQAVADTARYFHVEGTSQQEYDDFFHMIDNLLWDTNEQEGRMYRRGWMGMRRPMMLSSRSGQPSSLYRTIVNECYGILCELGTNGFVNRIGKMLAYWTKFSTG